MGRNGSNTTHDWSAKRMPLGLAVVACLLVAAVLPTLFGSRPAEAIVAGGMVDVDNFFDNPDLGYSKLSSPIQVSEDGGPDANYYWASNYGFLGGDGGYFGLQNRSAGLHQCSGRMGRSQGFLHPLRRRVFAGCRAVVVM